MVLWRHVLVESSWIEKNATRNLSVTLCGTLCMKYVRCQLWCHVKPHRCVLTSLIVSGSYQPLVSDEVLVCYTNKRPDYAAGASITSSGTEDSTRTADNLVDGIYNGNRTQTSIAAKDTWFLVDLGVGRVISEVLLMMAHTQSSGPVERFEYITVKVGDVKESGNFSSYALLGTFTGPGVSKQVVVLRPPTPLKGRYLSIQKMSGRKILEIAHLEIR